jgi:hypothetical protein
MLLIENTEVYGWEAAIRGMRNPMNSWEQSDSNFWGSGTMEFTLGEKDLDLMHRLRKAGTDHRKFMRMIIVTADLCGPLYWLKEYDTYKVSTVANSCSTMHKIHDKEFTLDDFSHEHLFDGEESGAGDDEFEYHLLMLIDVLNFARKKFLTTKDKKYWWQMIQLLPSSYNQRRTVMLNYEVLANIYKSRKNHKLDEWHTFCEWIEGLPYAELITGVAEDGK